jgi:hypothetical protein
VSRETLRASLVRYRETLDLLGPYAGPCLVCQAWPDRRHRQAEAIRDSLLAGETPEVAAEEYLREDQPYPVEAALEVAFAALAADRRLHRVTRDVELQIAREVYGA